MNWQYISGFFDGEGGVSIDSHQSVRVLILSASFAQKDQTVLDHIADFLQTRGIASTIRTATTGVHSLKVTRIRDAFNLFTRLNLAVKARQVETSLRYLRGEITGNELLLIFEEEFHAGRRRFSPLQSRELTHYLRHSEAVKLAGQERSQASRITRNCLNAEDIRLITASMPVDFEVRDVMSSFEGSKNRAYHLIRVMRSQGLVVCKRSYRPHHGRMILTRSY